MPKGKTALLIDGSGFAYRAYYAMNRLSTSSGFKTGGIYGFLRMLFKYLKKLQPELVAVFFDAGRKTFRSEIDKSYKTNRKPAPEDFKRQIPYIKRFLKALGIAFFELPGYEADDLIGSVAKQLGELGIESVILTSDKDMLQLLDEHTKVVMLKSGREKTYDVKKFESEFKIKPKELVEVFALSGDSVDNIPGIKGIGEKTALKLVKDWGSVERIFQNLEKLPRSVRNKLEGKEKDALLSKKLALIDTEAPIKITPKELQVKALNYQEILNLVDELEMPSLLKEINSIFKKAKTDSMRLSDEDEVFASDTPLFKKEVCLIKGKDGYLVGDGEIYAKLKTPSKLVGRKVYLYDLKEVYKGLPEVKDGKPVDVKICSLLLNPDKRKSVEEIFEIESESQRIRILFQTGKSLENKLDKKLRRLYEEVEKPLSFVLAAMEKRGIPIDREYLENLKKNLEAQALNLERRIYEEAGFEFNLNSPSQIAKLFFEKMGLKPVKKTRTGKPSADSEVLEKLSAMGISLAQLLLRHRKLKKTISTFILPLLERERDGRVYPHFEQIGAATGRLSCSEPNIQNLPVDENLIRKAIRASKGNLLVWADYSQIELRVLAHFSGDSLLIKAFESGRDVHLWTASVLFGKRLEDVTEKERSVAKMVNYGVIYGMSAAGLSKRLKIGISEAEEFISNYFQTFSGVFNFIRETLEKTSKLGYVETLFGRRRIITGINSKNPREREAAERMAVNSLIQGSAADIIKLAMIEVDRKLPPRAYLIMQIHDELVIESKRESAEEAQEILKSCMENAVSLKVPLKVKVKSSENWQK